MPAQKPARIPATVVTGFLGAGKTTLIRHLLENARGRRIALVINEFGDLGVDGEILRGCGIEGCGAGGVVELSNGCICCAVADDFVPAIEALLALDPVPDHIVIETSGLALPQPLVRAFDWPDIRTRVTVDGVVAVVDGKALAEGRFAADEGAVDRQRAADDRLSHATPLSALFEDQLACADLVLVNKTDLLAAAEAGAVAARLAAAARPGVRVVQARHGAAAPEVVLGLGIGAEDDLAARRAPHHDRHHHHDDHDDHHDGHGGHGEHGGHHHYHDDHGHDAFESVVLELPEIADPAALAARVEAAIRAHALLRVKGFAAVAGKPMRLVLQAVGPRVATHYDRPFAPGEARATRLVAIAEAGIDAAALAAMLTAAPAPAPAETA
ncbi:cobalamin biosynthesis protein CobW [Paralimibaculum aggregatum]|uniref:Cobalamin biosynthesis protein CobW n=1 Tax=Paralimibaculum aggregatum TaxID=3036245 RepID=A0ABQ6LU05_9RHOB|nr:cobalamin biosynthesis protein CobW [Limibaculum sp. NKW23]GMG85527.1 cobalamin biosynthesis protein CobW [Limibaculum sp. NKW23]